MAESKVIQCEERNDRLLKGSKTQELVFESDH